MNAHKTIKKKQFEMRAYIRRMETNIVPTKRTPICKSNGSNGKEIRTRKKTDFIETDFIE